jgi:hypothetical protein
VEEELFTSGENEVGAAVHTLENFVLEIHLRVSPFLHSRPGIRPEHKRDSMEIPEVNPYPSGSAHTTYAVFTTTTERKFL